VSCPWLGITQPPGPGYDGRYSAVRLQGLRLVCVRVCLHHRPDRLGALAIGSERDRPFACRRSRGLPCQASRPWLSPPAVPVGASVIVERLALALHQGRPRGYGSGWETGPTGLRGHTHRECLAAKRCRDTRHGLTWHTASTKTARPLQPQTADSLCVLACRKSLAVAVIDPLHFLGDPDSVRVARLGLHPVRNERPHRGSSPMTSIASRAVASSSATRARRNSMISNPPIRPPRARGRRSTVGLCLGRRCSRIRLPRST
jgi:hypothetical protein